MSRSQIRRSMLAAAFVLMLVSSVLVVPGVASAAGAVDPTIAPAEGTNYTRTGSGAAVPFTLRLGGYPGSSACAATITWDYGDGTSFGPSTVTFTKNDPTAFSHTYTTLGALQSHVTIAPATSPSGNCGGDHDVVHAYRNVTILNQAPHAHLQPVLDHAAGEAFTLDATGSADFDGSIVSYEFFLDGASQGVTGSPTLLLDVTIAGTHAALVVATDNDGATDDFEISFDVTPAEASVLDLVGPSTMVAGSTATFSYTVVDAYGNLIDANSLEYTADTQANPDLLCQNWGALSDCITIEVVADALDHIVVSGPPTVQVGSLTPFAVAGFDQYENPVALSATTVDFTAPTTPSIETVSYTENGITGSTTVDVTAGDVVEVVVSGPSTAVVGTLVQYEAVAYDAYGNLVDTPFFWSSGGGDACQGLPFDANGLLSAPTTATSCSLYANAQGVIGWTNTDFVADLLVDIVFSTSGSDVVATHAVGFVAEGRDQYGNFVALDHATLDATCGSVLGSGNSLTFWAPSLVGSCVVTQTQDGVSESATFTVVPDALAFIALDGPSSLVAGTSGLYALAGSDAHGNAVALSQASLEYVAPTLVGSYQACYAEGSVTGCADVAVTPDALATIVIYGPDTVVAGAAEAFPVAGFDQHGNDVALETSIILYVAPTSAGPDSVAYTEAGVTGSRSILVVAAPLDHIVVSGPDVVVAGTTHDYALAGFDEYENPVPLAQSSLSHAFGTTVGDEQVSYEEDGVAGALLAHVVADQLYRIVVGGPDRVIAGATDSWGGVGYDQYDNVIIIGASTTLTAPTSVGTISVCVEQDGIEGCRLVEVIPDALDEIVITGASEAVAGSSHVFDVAGFDQYGNAVALSISTIDWAAPTSVGSVTIEHTENGVTGTHDVLVVPDVLATITVTGETTLVAGTSATYGLAGFDQYQNAVALAQTSLEYAAPTLVGTYTVSYAEGDATGSLDVSVVHAALAAIALSGPTQMIAGTTVSFALAGFDQYGNDVPLAVGSIDFTHTVAGTQTASYSEQSITGVADVDVLPDALASIVVSGPDALVAGSTASFDLAGFDQYGNAVALLESSVSYTAPLATGTDTVTYTEAGIVGSKLVQIVGADLSLVVTPDGGRYLPPLALAGIRGQVAVRFPGYGPAPGALVHVVIKRDLAVGVFDEESFDGVANAAGQFAFSPSPEFRLVGDYTIEATATYLGNAGSGTGSYHVGV